MADVELLPCPFCGSPAHLNTIRTSDKEFIRLNGRDTGYGVNCEQCGTTNRGFAYGWRTVEKAVEHWNTRANLAPLQAENERLRAEVEESDAVVDKLARLLAETAIVIKGPEPDMTKWSYHDIPDGVRAIQARAERLAEALRDARDCAESHLGLLIVENMSDGVEQTKALITKIDAALAQEDRND